MQSRLFAVFTGLLAIGAALAFAVPSGVAQDEPVLTGQDEPGAVIIHPCARPACAPACPPCIVYKGCPAPCSVDKVVTVCKPCGCTVDVVIKVPANECERVRVHKDGDARYHYGRYGVHVDWKDRGSKLVVRYHG
jgi:hypothetical protein